MADDERPSADAVTAGFFGLEIDGGARAVFFEAAISSEVELVAAPGAPPNPPQTRRLRPAVTLTRRHDTDLQLFAWHQSVVDGPLASARKNGTLALFDASGVTVARYRLELAWPLKLTIGPGVFGGEAIVAETIVLVCDNVRRVAL